MDAARALDVGCGMGEFAALLHERVPHVDGIDRYTPGIEVARSRFPDVTFTESDLFDFDGADYDFISLVASLHHMPLEPALLKLRDMLAPGGVLAVLNIARYGEIHPSLALTIPANLALGALYFGRRKLGFESRVRSGSEADVPIQDPELSSREFAEETARILPGRRIRRLLLFRSALLYQRVV